MTGNPYAPEATRDLPDLDRADIFADAKCVEIGIWEADRLFFHGRTGREAGALHAQAKALCDSCPRFVECLADEDRHPTADGFRAGMTHDERAIRRRKNREAN